MIPIHILGGLKSIPHSSRTSVYTFIMEVTPPPCVFECVCHEFLQDRKSKNIIWHRVAILTVTDFFSRKGIISFNTENYVG